MRMPSPEVDRVTLEPAVRLTSSANPLMLWTTSPGSIIPLVTAPSAGWSVSTGSWTPWGSNGVKTGAEERRSPSCRKENATIGCVEVISIEPSRVIEKGSSVRKSAMWFKGASSIVLSKRNCPERSKARNVRDEESASLVFAMAMPVLMSSSKNANSWRNLEGSAGRTPALPTPEILKNRVASKRACDVSRTQPLRGGPAGSASTRVRVAFAGSPAFPDSPPFDC